MEILLKNNIIICFSSMFSRMESIINHNQDEASTMIMTNVSKEVVYLILILRHMLRLCSFKIIQYLKKVC